MSATYRNFSPDLPPENHPPAVIRWGTEIASTVTHATLTASKSQLAVLCRRGSAVCAITFAISCSLIFASPVFLGTVRRPWFVTRSTPQVRLPPAPPLLAPVQIALQWSTRGTCVRNSPDTYWVVHPGEVPAAPCDRSPRYPKCGCAKGPRPSS